MTHTLNHRSEKSRVVKGFQQFIFIGNTSSRLAKFSACKLPLSDHSSLLNKTSTGNSLVVTQICTTKNITRQLRHVHFKLGKIVKLVNKTHNGSVIVEVDDRLIGIGSEIAQKIIVTLASSTRS